MRNVKEMEGANRRKTILPTMTEKNVAQMWQSVAWSSCGLDVPVIEGATVNLAM